MEIVNFAEKTKAEARAALEEERPSKRRKGTEHRQRDFIKGLNLQAVCKNQFGDRLGRIKVCQLCAQAKEQKWSCLTIQQQKSMYQLTDSLKLSLGLMARVKGYKSMNVDQIKEKLQHQKALQRWTIPGPVLEDRRKIPLLLCHVIAVI